MSKSSCDFYSWDAIIERLGRVVDLELSARQFKAFERAGKIKCATDVLRLALMYGPGQLSLIGTALAASATVASISDKAVEGRLRKAGDWMQHLLECLLRSQTNCRPGGALALSLVDGSLIAAPGNAAQWRLHANYDPGAGRFRDLRLTKADISEAVDRTALASDRLLIMDRGYARVRNFKSIIAAGSDFITRVGWRSLVLQTEAGGAFDIIASLPKDEAPSEHRVRVGGFDHALRLVMQRLPADKVASNEKRVSRRSARSGHEIDLRTIAAAGYVMLLTSVSAKAQPAHRVLELYRARWQVELGFKRLKTLGGIDKLPSADARLARTWLLAHLIVAVLTDELANQIAGVPPWEDDGLTPTRFVMAGVGPGTPDPAASDLSIAA